MIRLQLPCDKTAGTVNMTEIFIKPIPEETVKPGVYSLLFSQMQGIGDIFRLYMKSRRMGDIQFPRNFQPLHTQPEWEQKMNQISPADGLPQHFFIRPGKYHPLFCHNMTYNGRKKIFFYKVFSISRIPRTHHSHLMPMSRQRMRQSLGSHGSPVISSVILINNQ